jgi:hypothetical protein
MTMLPTFLVLFPVRAPPSVAFYVSWVSKSAVNLINLLELVFNWAFEYAQSTPNTAMQA